MDVPNTGGKVPRIQTWPTARRAALAAVILAGVPIAACDLALSHLNERATDTWTRSYPLVEDGVLEIDNTNGLIEVTAVSGSSVEVRAERIARAHTTEAAKELLTRATMREEVSPNRVRIAVERPKGGFGPFRSNVEVRYTVSVPSTARVHLSNTNGAVRVSGVTRGVKVGTTNGEITGERLGGRVSASTTNGEIKLELSDVSGDVEVSTTNGPVTLRVPSDARASVSARWTNGGIDIAGLPITAEGERNRRRFDGQLNGGGNRIDVSTTNGGITLAAAEGAAQR
jgi:DUF4097 and DUF4098 domain-containing protein YvlB